MNVPATDIRCEDCGAPYRYEARVKAEISTCECLTKKYAATQQESQYKIFLGNVRDRVLRLELGKIRDIDTGVPDIGGGWSDPVAAIKAEKNLVLVGPVGTAKTTKLKQVAYHAALGGLRVRGGYVLQMLRQLKDFEDMAALRAYSAWLEEGDILILDDLDKLASTPYEVKLLLDFIDRYWRFGRSIAATMNESLADLKKKMQAAKGADEKSVEALLDRLHDGAHIETLVGGSHRGAL